MTLSELSVTIVLLGVLGLTASRFGMSAIPAYLLAGIILGPNEPKILSLVQPSEVTAFVGRDRPHLPALLPRARVQRRPARSQRPPRRSWGRTRPARQRRPRPARGGRRVRLQLRRHRRGGVHLRVVQRDRGQGADRLPPSRRRRDRPRPGDPALRGHRDRSRAGLRRHGWRRSGGDGDGRARRRSCSSARRSLPRAGSGRPSAGCSHGSSSSSSCSPCSASSSG